MYYIYILYSEKSNLYYVGYTRDYSRRFHEHNNSDRNTFTAKHRPWKIAAIFKYFGTKAQAITLERFIKKQKSRSLICNLIDENYIPIGKLHQLVRVPQLRD
jgi:putative endonuclease